jgi:hypothetical protein
MNPALTFIVFNFAGSLMINYFSGYFNKSGFEKLVLG